MSDVAALIADLVSAGTDPALVGRVAAAIAEASREASPSVTQFTDMESPPNAHAARQRRYRDRLRASSLPVTVTLGDVTTVTTSPPSPSPSLKEIPPTPPKENNPTPTPSTPKQSKRTRLAADWVLPKSMGDWALAQGLPRDRILIEAEKMRDWSINAGGKGLKADWFAAWRNWVKGAIDNLPRARGSPGAAETPIERRKRELAERIQNEHGIGRERGSDPPDAGLFPVLLENKR